VRVGIVGLGKMGQIRAQCCQQVGIEIGAVCDIDPRQLGRFHMIAPSQFHTDYRDLCARRDIDAVFACAFNNVQASVVAWALDQGKHVFCEKPPGRNLSDLRLMDDTLGSHPGLVLMFGFNHRWHEHVLLAKRAIQEHRYGTPLWIRAQYTSSGHTGLWRQIPLLSGGGVLLDLGIHVLDLLYWFTGEEFETLQGLTSLVDTHHFPCPVDDNVFALLRSKTGISASVHFSASSQPSYGIEIGLSNGNVQLNGFCSPSGRYSPATYVAIPRDASADIETKTFEINNSFHREVNLFRQAVESGKPVAMASIVDAKRAMQLAFSLQKGAA